MLTNYLKIAYRNLLKSKGFSIINIIGLAIGVACCILIMLFVVDELSYDRYHEKSDRIYRAGLQGVLNNRVFNGVVTCAPLANTLMTEFREVETATRFRNFGFPVFRYKDKVFSEERVFWADSTFFEVFTVTFIKGDSKTALNQQNNIVLTQSMARKYFGDENPIGKSLNADNRIDYTVAAVIEDVPHNSHFHFDFLASLAHYEDSRIPNWTSNNYYTYFVLQQGASPELLEQKLFESVKIHIEPQIKAGLGISVDQFFANGGDYRYFLQPLENIHLHSHLELELEPNGDIAYVYIFSTIALGILLIACINFVNLATARSTLRAREVGIRKTVGSHRGQLIRQFLSETIFLSLLAVLLAVLIVYLFLPTFNSLSRKELSFPIFDNMAVIPILLGLVLVIGILAGTYPAFFLASFHPVNVIKGDVIKGQKKSLMRSILVVLQFTISVFLIIGTILIRQQLTFIQNKNPGFNKEQVIIIHKTDDLGKQIQPFKQELLKNPQIVSASNSVNVMGNPFWNSVFKIVGATGEESQLLWMVYTDPDFIKTYEMELAAGRFFEKDRLADQTGIVINETAVQVLGLTDPIGTELKDPDPNVDRRYSIIGVVKDFHFESMHQQIRPLMILPFRPDGLGRYLSVRIQGADIRNTIEYLEKTWHQFAANQAFEYEFFDDHFARIYLAEQRIAQIFLAFSALSIIIACLGLFGLAAFITEQRTKEIGIRKVLGATVTGIIFLLTRQFSKWVLLANIIAWPCAYWALNRWLQDFAYRVDISVRTFLFWKTFALATFLALLIALLTVSYQSIKAALTNPVTSLKYE